MLNNSSRKLKTFAKVELILCFVLAGIILVGGFIGMIAVNSVNSYSYYGYYNGAATTVASFFILFYCIFIAVIIIIAGWVSALKLYAFAELVESNQQMCSLMLQDKYNNNPANNNQQMNNNQMNNNNQTNNNQMPY